MKHTKHLILITLIAVFSAAIVPDCEAQKITSYIRQIQNVTRACSQGISPAQAAEAMKAFQNAKTMIPIQPGAAGAAGAGSRLCTCMRGAALVGALSYLGEKSWGAAIDQGLALMDDLEDLEHCPEVDTSVGGFLNYMICEGGLGDAVVETAEIVGGSIVDDLKGLWNDCFN